jgi:Domain of unknown function (DUF4249)
MWKRKSIYFLILSLIFSPHCKKAYQAKLKQTNNNYLVVGGIINTTANGQTTIFLSRTVNLSDSNTNMPELNATVFIEGKTGNKYPLNQQGSNGAYTSDSLTLNNMDLYRLDIATQDGDSFQSDFVPCRQTPPIDSVNWSQNQFEDVNIFVNTHDPTDSSRFYWWDYTETWEYQSPLVTLYGVSNGLIYLRDSIDQVHVCWMNNQSTDLILGTDIQLSHDVVSMQPLLTIPNLDSRLFYRYSLLVDQYALERAAYQYWATIKVNSQELGTLFDPQPSQLGGNIYSIKNPGEPVVGYVSAAKKQQMRIFIDYSQVMDWPFDPLGKMACSLRVIGQDTSNYSIYNYPDTSYAPYYFVSNGTLYIAKRSCLDCTLMGGTNQQPSFW